MGVTTLAAFHGCPLRCKYCLNRRCLEPPEELPRYTPQQLYDRVNTEADCDLTAARLKAMGATRIDRFTYRVQQS